MTRTNHSYTVIQNEGAYESAIHNRIRANRRKTAAAKFETLADHAQIVDLLERRVSGPTTDRYNRGDLSDLRQARELSFIDSAWFYMIEGGAPTDGQIEAIRRMIVKNAERRVERAAQDAASEHIAKVGERVELTLTIRNIASFEGMYGMTHIHVMGDAAGNVVVYKGSTRFGGEADLGYRKNEDGTPALVWAHGARGDTVVVKGTVKAHEVREGVKQTILARPKLVTFTKAAA